MSQKSKACNFHSTNTMSMHNCLFGIFLTSPIPQHDFGKMLKLIEAENTNWSYTILKSIYRHLVSNYIIYFGTSTQRRFVTRLYLYTSWKEKEYFNLWVYCNSNRISTPSRADSIGDGQFIGNKIQTSRNQYESC